ncbi:SAF domain-containing protein [Williamsia maris]|uniref:SAF domain-containing protein n=1 Tax=Williamsia maris TaxID=72806 RepID=A0ABT1H8I4_9NOCA|nr:SAF domain-containing protein [Williamsia maris]MCP2174580.1 SAF domain-containing protein [Williamsia maris]
MPADRFRLQPTIVDRLRATARPGWTRALAVRRTLAVALLVASIVAAVVAHRGEQQVTVMIAAHDLSPGTELSATDLAELRIGPGLLPQGALRMTRDGVGRTVTGPVHRGEVLTDWRLLSPRLPTQLMDDPDARLVPVRLADDAVVRLLRSGDVVDVLTEAPDPERSASGVDGVADERDSRAAATSPTASGRVLVRGAVVAVVAAPESRAARGSAAPVIMLAMGEREAHTVAGATLAAPLTVVFH